ncbi:SIR2 family NAD-dependent protein deacylase [Slackia piriformis]
MSRLMGLYAQHLSAGVAPPAVDEETLARQVEQAANVLARADAVVCGIGSGMSTACGYDHYGRSAVFDGRFAKFERVHGFSSLMDGLYHLYASNEERWGFLAAYSAHLEAAPVGRAYRQLARLLEGKEYFVLTTNIDGQVRRAFPGENVWLFQGDFGFLQCGQPCCDELVPALPVARAMLDAMGDGIAAPSDLLPRCPHCGWLRAPWVRDHGFLEGDAWRDGKRRYERFVSDALASGGRVVFLELGVGGMTPSIIEIPFWEMTRTNSNAFYLRVNMGKASEPRQLEGRSLTVTGDIADVFDMLTHQREKKEQDA